jgi:hypothetical protein
MVKSSSPNAPSTWIIFLFLRTHASPQTCQHSASSVLAVRISCRVIAVCVFRKPLWWTPLTKPTHLAGVFYRPYTTTLQTPETAVARASANWKVVSVCDARRRLQMYNVVYGTFIITSFNVANVLLCVIYQLNFTGFMYVTLISRYMTLYKAFGIIRGFA